jgi:hypothetical protein
MAFRTRESSIKNFGPTYSWRSLGHSYQTCAMCVVMPRQWVALCEGLKDNLERVAGDGLIAFNHAEIAWGLMTDADAFSDHLKAIDQDQAVDAIASLEAYEDEVTPDRVLPGVVTLLNMLPTLPESERGMFGFGTQMAVGRVVYRLVRSQDSETFVEGVVRDALPRLNTAFSKLMLIQMVGHREGIGVE